MNQHDEQQGSIPLQNMANTSNNEPSHFGDTVTLIEHGQSNPTQNNGGVASDRPVESQGSSSDLDTSVTKNPNDFNRDWRFWMILVTLAFSGLLASLESTIVITSLPTIVGNLHLGSSYIWISNIFFLMSAICQPLFAQLSNLFGRKAVLMFIFAAYTVGSGVAGAANNSGTIIAGRAIMGIGSGGINMAAEVIISDLVPLRVRGNYVALMQLVATIGFSVGPVVGGVIAEKTSWRWVFYLNLPIGVFGFFCTYFFLNLKWNREETTAAKLRTHRLFLVMLFWQPPRSLY